LRVDIDEAALEELRAVFDERAERGEGVGG
jgi:hypothetical protein